RRAPRDSPVVLRTALNGLSWRYLGGAPPDDHANLAHSDEGPSAAPPIDDDESDSDSTGRERRDRPRREIRQDVEKGSACIGLPRDGPVTGAILVLDGHVEPDRKEEARARQRKGRREVHRPVRGRPTTCSGRGQWSEIAREGRPHSVHPPLQL